MTKSTITRERLEKIKSWRETYGAGSNVMLPAEDAEELARIALAAMDSEPVAYMYRDNLHSDARFSLESKIGNWSPEDINEYEISETPLYRHAQQPVVPDYPETLPCPVLLEPGMRFGKGVKTRLVLDVIQRRAEHYAELEAMTPEERAEYDANIEAFKAMLPQPAPVVPDERDKTVDADDHPLLWSFNEGWNACRAAMLQVGNSPVIPDGWQVEAEKLAEMHGMSFVLFRHGEAPQCADPTKVVISFTDKGLGHDTLPSGPREEK